MTTKLIAQWTAAVLAVPVVCVATYKIAASSTALSVPKLPPPVVVVQTPSPTPSEAAPSPTPMKPKPVAKPSPTAIVTPKATAEPTASPTPEPIVTLPVAVPTAPLSIVTRHGSAHLVYLYRSATNLGPRPSSCANWEPVVTARGVDEGKARRAGITRASLSFPGDSAPSSQLVSSFACDWDFAASVPQGQSYTVSVAMGQRSGYSLQLSTAAPWAFSADTLSPQISLVKVLVSLLR